MLLEVIVEKSYSAMKAGARVFTCWAIARAGVSVIGAGSIEACRACAWEQRAVHRASSVGTRCVSACYRHIEHLWQQTGCIG